MSIPLVLGFLASTTGLAAGVALLPIPMAPVTLLLVGLPAITGVSMQYSHP